MAQSASQAITGNNTYNTSGIVVNNQSELISIPFGLNIVKVNSAIGLPSITGSTVGVNADYYKAEKWNKGSGMYTIILIGWQCKIIINGTSSGITAKEL